MRRILIMGLLLLAGCTSDSSYSSETGWSSSRVNLFLAPTNSRAYCPTICKNNEGDFNSTALRITERSLVCSRSTYYTSSGGFKCNMDSPDKVCSELLARNDTCEGFCKEVDKELIYAGYEIYNEENYSEGALTCVTSDWRNLHEFMFYLEAGWDE